MTLSSKLAGFLIIILLLCCQEKPPLPKQSDITYQSSTTSERVSVNSGAFGFQTLAGRFKINTFVSIAEAKDYFAKDIPQRPEEQGEAKGVLWVSSRNALWLRKTNQVAYYVLFPQEGWNNLSQTKYQKKKKLVADFCTKTIIRWQN